MSSQISPTQQKIKRNAFLIGVIGIVVALFGLWQGLVQEDARPVYSWLIGFTVWFGIGVGMLLITMIWHLFDAGWSVIVRRQLEHALSALPYIWLFFLPLLLIGWFYNANPGILWKWMNPDLIPAGSHNTVSHDPLYLNKSGFLNLQFFTIRVFLYAFLFWFFSKKLRTNSFKMDKNSDPKHVLSSRFFSAMGIPVIALTATFAAFDFFMSLYYHWFSTMYGVWFFATSMRAALAVTVIILAVLSTRGHLKGILKRGHLYLLGCMFLAFTVFWAYICFSQYFLIYHPSIPEETFWFNIREWNEVTGEKNSWWWVSMSLIFGYFFIPFFTLLFYKTKVVMKRMVFISCWILTFFVVDLYFNILPEMMPDENVLGYTVREFSVTLWDAAAIIGLGGICVWAFMRSISKAEAIPVHDPRIEESLHPHE